MKDWEALNQGENKESVTKYRETLDNLELMREGGKIHHTSPYVLIQHCTCVSVGVWTCGRVVMEFFVNVRILFFRTCVYYESYH